MATLNPYLNFNGNAEEAFTFYKSVFGGEFDAVMRFKDMPAEYQTNESESNKIMHISLPVGEHTVLMGSDVPEAFGKAVVGTHAHISIRAQTEEEARRIFNGLAEGGSVAMPLEQAFWGDLFGMLKDQFGVQWMMSYAGQQHA